MTESTETSLTLEASCVSPMESMDLSSPENQGYAFVDMKCRICQQPTQDAVSVICGHWFFALCLQKYFNLIENVRPRMCPFCKYAILDEKKDLHYVERELEKSSAERYICYYLPNLMTWGLGLGVCQILSFFSIILQFIS